MSQCIEREPSGLVATVSAVRSWHICMEIRDGNQSPSSSILVITDYLYLGIIYVYAITIHYCRRKCVPTYYKWFLLNVCIALVGYNPATTEAWERLFQGELPVWYLGARRGRLSFLARKTGLNNLTGSARRRTRVLPPNRKELLRGVEVKKYLYRSNGTKLAKKSE